MHTASCFAASPYKYWGPKDLWEVLFLHCLQDGYTDNFKVVGQGLFAPSTEKSYRPEQVHVINFYRFEGESDPSDNSILYVIETDDGAKGMLNDAYGAYADEAVNKFMRQVEDMNKKVIKEDKPN